ncbi:uncharacterized protein [Porites lutea]|uniref:uncharacterized protein n=1 Tax=Porites lutea TaxID=51062 RepID=UPI003CC6B8C7
MVTSMTTYGRVEAAQETEKSNPQQPNEFYSLCEDKDQPSPGAKEPRYKNIVHLWEYLLELLAEDSCRSLITWSNKERGEFKLKNPGEVAKRWGLLKRKRGMNYEKLSRALRYYYQQGIIKKVPGQRLVYKFNKLPYKYEPGVTRATRHASKISASIHEEHEQRLVTPPSPTLVTPPSPSKTSAFEEKPSSPFSPTTVPFSKSWSWPVVHVPRCPLCSCPSNIPLLCSTGSGSNRSRIIFPSVNQITPSWPIPVIFKPNEPLSPVYEPSCPPAWKM